MYDCAALTEQTRESAAATDIALLAGTVIARLQDRSLCAGEDRVEQATEMLILQARASALFDAAACAARLRRLNLTDAVLTDHVIPSVARQFGCDWEADRVSFADVTVATARLQSLLPELAPSWRDADIDRLDRPATGFTGLLVLPREEAHTLGPQVILAQFRRHGVEVEPVFGPSPDAIDAALRYGGRCDMVLFSCARRRHLSFVAEIMSVVAGRGADAPTGILGGHVLDLESGLQDLTGVDLVTNDVQTALTYCRRAPRADIAGFRDKADWISPT